MDVRAQLFSFQFDTILKPFVDLRVRTGLVFGREPAAERSPIRAGFSFADLLGCVAVQSCAGDLRSEIDQIVIGGVGSADGGVQGNARCAWETSHIVDSVLLPSKQAALSPACRGKGRSLIRLTARESAVSFNAQAILALG